MIRPNSTSGAAEPDIRLLLLDVLAGQREIIAKLDAQVKSDLTITEFAQRTHRSRSYIHKKIKLGLIRTKSGRIPFSELNKFATL